MSKRTLHALIINCLLMSAIYASNLNAQHIISVRDASIKIKLENANLMQILRDIEARTDYEFSYEYEDLDPNIHFSVKFKNASVADVLLEISKQTNLKFRQVNNNIHISKKSLKNGNDKVLEVIIDGITITGKIISAEDGSGLPGVNVIVKGTSLGTVTDVEGNYSLDVPDQNSVLVFSSVGYIQEEIVVGARTIIDITLMPDITSLEEIVVIGYGTQKKRDVTGAISSVKTEEVSRAITTSAEEFLQGRISGVTVSQSSNAPGGGISVRVRGTNSITGGNEPLYVIDGIPIANSDQKNNTEPDLRFAGRNPSLSPLSMINPQDIESIEVLKDASATAIYGARGANGVVIITTKKGREGRAAMEWSSSYGVQEATRLPDLLNSRQFMELNNEARANSGRDVVFTDDMLNNPPYDTDWQDELYRSAAVQNHNLSIRGGDDRTLYAVSLGYFDQKGVMIGTDLKRYSARLNLERQATNWFKTGVNINYSRTVQNNTITEGSNGVTRTVNEMVPLGPVRIGNEWFANQDMIVEDFDYGLEEANVSSKFNPIFFADEVRNETINDRMLGSVFGEIKFNEDLDFRSTVGADIVNGRLFYFTPSTAVSDNSALTQYYNSSHLSIQNQLTFQKRFDKHGISAVLVQSAEQYRYDRIEVLAEDIYDATENYNFDTDTRELNDKFPTADNWTLASFLGRVNYDYSGRYLLTASFRYDGSARFGDGKRWGFFPAISLGWNIADEDFFNVSSISSLKLRVGWGVNGSQEISSFLYKSLARGTRAVMGGNLFAGVEPSNISNTDLGWESTRQINVGIDAGFLDERFTLSANVYDKLTTDLLFKTDIPLTSGHKDITQNIGEVSNRGWEMELGGNIINGEFTWNASFNYSRNKNRIEALDGVVDTLITDNKILTEGLALNTTYGYLTNGLWQQSDEEIIPDGPQPGARPGDRRYVDFNGDNTINGDDRVGLGSSLPISSFGLNNTFRYQGIELTVFIQGLGGMKKYNSLMASVENTSGTENASIRVLDRWTPENTNTQVQSALQTGRQNVPPSSSRNDYYVEDASFWRLKNVTLAYNFPNALVSRIGLSSLRVSLNGQNLATFTNFTITDPEAGAGQNGYPLVRTISAGLNIGF